MCENSSLTPVYQLGIVVLQGNSTRGTFEKTQKLHQTTTTTTTAGNFPTTLPNYLSMTYGPRLTQSHRGLESIWLIM